MKTIREFEMNWMRKLPIWIGLIVPIMLSTSVSGQDPDEDQNPAPPPVFRRSAISDAQISVLINKRNWEKILEYGNAAVEPLIKALKDNDEVIRAETAAALGIIGDKRAVEPLVDSLKDKDLHVRQQAAKALGKLGSSLAAEPLARCLNDHSREVRLEAVEALKSIAGEWSFKYLVKSLNDSDASVRRETVKALLLIGGKRAVMPFLEYLKDPESKSKVEVIRALGVLGDKRAIDPMISFLKDKDPSVRMWSVEVLRRIGDDRAVEPLKKCLEDPDQGVRNKASEALKKFRVAVKPAETARPVKAAIPNVDKKTETPVTPQQVSVPAKETQDTNPQALPLETVKETRPPEMEAPPVETGKKNSSFLWIYAIIAGAVGGLVLLVLKMTRRKTSEEINWELDRLASQIREISRRKTNDSVKDAALNLLEAHATAFAHFPSDGGSAEEKGENLDLMDDSIARISKMLGSGHRGIRLLLKMKILVKKAMGNGHFGSPPSSGDAKLKTMDAGAAPVYGKRTPLAQLEKSITHCAKCGCPVPPAGPAADESAERVLIEQSKPPTGILSLKKLGGEAVLLAYLKKHEVGLFCSKCPTAWCPFCANPNNPSTCSICGSDMVMHRKK